MKDECSSRTLSKKSTKSDGSLLEETRDDAVTQFLALRHIFEQFAHTDADLHSLEQVLVKHQHVVEFPEQEVAKILGQRGHPHLLVMRAVLFKQLGLLFF
jgi:hypothetical protein